MANHSFSTTTRDLTDTNLYGLVLAGGYSTRMGSDKGILNYNGKPQREFLFDLLGGTCAKVFTSCRRDQVIPSQLNPLPDHFHIPGPMNGILSAFAFNPESSWLTVAVDMPFVRASALDLLVFNRDKSKMATCFFNPGTQQPEPLLTLWEASAYPALLKFWEKGNTSPRDFLKTHPARMIQPPDEKTLLNYNYPAELQ